MNKVDRIKLDTVEGRLEFDVTFDAEVVQDGFTIYIDEAYNLDNIECDDFSKHNHVLTKYNSKFIFLDTHLKNKYHVIVNSIDIREFTQHIKYIKVIATYWYDHVECNPEQTVAQGIYYNALPLYEAEIYGINKYCSTCLDDWNMQLIAYAVFRRLLLEDAIKLNHYKEALSFYMDLCRLFGISNETKPSCCKKACPTCG